MTKWSFKIVSGKDILCINYLMVLFLCISAVFCLKKKIPSPSQVTKQVDWEGVINLVFVYLHPEPGPTIVSRVPAHPQNQGKLGDTAFVYFARKMLMFYYALYVSFSIWATSNKQSKYIVNLWIFQRATYTRPQKKQSPVGAIVLEPIWLRGGGRDSPGPWKRAPLRSAARWPPDPKCFPTPSILLPF